MKIEKVFYPFVISLFRISAILKKIYIYKYLLFIIMLIIVLILCSIFGKENNFFLGIILIVILINSFIFYLSSLAFQLYKSLNLFDLEITNFFHTKGIDGIKVNFIKNYKSIPSKLLQSNNSFFPYFKIGGLINIYSYSYREVFLDIQDQKEVLYVKLKFKFNLNVEIISSPSYP